jgi:hypothetical protein
LNEKPNVAKARREWPSWERGVGLLVIVSLVASSRLGRRLPMIFQDVAFLVTVSVPLILIGMSWIGFRFLRREGMEARWRMWMALLGCVALSVSLAIPFFVLLFGLPATQWTVWIFGSSVVALLSGMFAPRRLKFPLMFGGLVMGGLLFIIPIGIL